MKKIFLNLLMVLAFQTLTVCRQPVKGGGENRNLEGRQQTVQSVDGNQVGNVSETAIEKLEIPQTTPQEEVISHTGYSFLYSEPYEQAKWVAYELTREETNKGFERTNQFIPDLSVSTGSADNADYARSGYDRGHLAPAGDMGWSATAMAESFYYSNMSPQEPGFNRGVWKRLEELVRIWAVDYQSVYVVTGPVLTNGLRTIGSNNVAVPKYYYKVILDYHEPESKGIGFILPNCSSGEPLQRYAVTIDSVEHFTGIDFFPKLADDLGSRIESDLTVTSWAWTSSTTANQKEKTSLTGQCIGVTKSGARCKNNTRNASEYCYLHEGQSK
jgi:endonuclease G